MTDLTIWEVARATTATPFYFESLTAETNGERRTFRDGAIRANNPAAAAYNELLATNGENCEPALLLSIGTGVPENNAPVRSNRIPNVPGPLQRLLGTSRVVERAAVFKDFLVKYTEGELTHETMNRVASGADRWYKRLNVSTGLGGIPLDAHLMSKSTNEWDPRSTAGTIKAATDLELSRDLDLRYDSNAPPKQVIKEIAQKLVRHRRAREFLAVNGDPEDRKKWETFMGRDLREERTFYIDYWTELEGANSPSLRPEVYQYALEENTFAGHFGTPVEDWSDEEGLK